MPKEIYDEGNPQYRCCCGCHVQTGTMIICLIYLFVYLGLLIHRVTLNLEPIVITVAVILAAIAAAAFGIGFFGAKNEKPKWLIPAMIVLVSFLLGLVLIEVIGLIKHGPKLAAFIIYIIIDGMYGVLTFLTTKTPRILFYENFDEHKKIAYPYDNTKGDVTAIVIAALIVRTLVGIAFNSWLFSIVLSFYRYLTAKNLATGELPAYRHPI